MTTAAILVCRDAFRPRTCLNASAVAELLRSREPPLTMHLVDDFCARPDRLRAGMTGDAGRLVLGVCSRDVPAAEIQQWGRRSGLDPFAVEWVPLSFAAAVARDDPVRGQETAAIQLAASAARLMAFLGSEPEHLRMRFAGGVSRRAVLSLPPLLYEPVARVDQNACLGGERCGLCVSACPIGSISATGGGVDVNRASCVACGICVSRCPTGAITLPGASLGQYEAQLRTLLSQTGPLAGPVGILIGCRHARGALDAVPENTSVTVRWIPLEVPTLGMVTAGWFLQALAAGAVAVAVLACPDDLEDCGLVGERVDFCRKALQSVGHDAHARLRILSGKQEEWGTGLGDPPSGRLVSRMPADGVSLREPRATAQALLSLWHTVPTPTPVRHAASPLGVVRINHARCTACGACASACPTGALRLQEHTDEVRLQLDPAACTACQHCVSACPERALTVHPETNVVTLAAGTVVPKTSAVTKCRGCGRPVAPDAMIRRVRSLLADQPADLLDALGTLCGGCRTATAVL